MSASACETLTIERFEASAIDPASFDHEAHVYIGWLYVMAYPHEDAIARCDSALRRFTEKIGATAKYNSMITWLFLKLIAARARTGEDWPAFRQRNADLLDDRPRSPAS